ncbi:MAG: TIGR04211 family SH3 domain-containing protein [Deltaproteobacteria bacterium]|nr:MAG: TIGR04211 family SH3 domain-containing protein [Deltaproteobacteria bacterium]
MPRSLLLLIFLALLPGPVFAATGYVTDQLVLTLRTTADIKAEALDHLKTDTRVEILGEEGRFLHVRTEDGKEGYVLKQYITDRVPKTIQLARQADEIAKLKQQLAALSDGGKQAQQQAEALARENAALKDKLAAALAQRDSVDKKYRKLLADSANLVQLTQERDQLRQENARLAAEVTRLNEENTSLLTTGSIKWFLAGAGVLFFGWVMGKLSRKKRRPF